jgi:hypothetical protein
VKRSLLVILLAAIAAAFAATPAFGKEDVEATLDTRIPLNASPGEQLRIAWTLGFVDDRGKRQPFGAQGVFVRLLSASGGKATTGFGSGDGGRTGKYEATVVVPEGGIGALAIGLGGTISGPTGSSRSDVYFPVKNSPFPASVPAPSEVRGDATPASPDESSSNSSASTWLGGLALALLLALGGLAVVLWHRRRRSKNLSVRRLGV